MKNRILFILATHGDESFSIEIFKRIEKRFPRDSYYYDWIIGSSKALKKNVRFIEVDLNRSAPGKLNSSVYEVKRAFEIVQLANKYNYVIDIHGSISNTGVFTIIPKPSIQNILLAALLPIKRNVLWYSEQSLNNGPIVQFCKSPALEIECGSKNDPKIALELEDVIVKLLKGMKNQDYTKLFESLSKKEFYTVYGSQKKSNKNMKDFISIRLNNELFYPLLVNQYREVACYKMKKVNFQDLFLN